MAPLLNYIDGRFVPSKAGRTREYINPADNSVLGVAAESDASDVENAIGAARVAFDNGPWPWTPAAERAVKLFKLADLIESNAEELARMDTLNSGKPLREARFDAADAAGCFRFYAGLATKPQGQTYEVGDPNIAAETVREPIGVCGQIIPWNYPLLMASLETRTRARRGKLLHPQALGTYSSLGSSTFRIDRRKPDFLQELPSLCSVREIRRARRSRLATVWTKSPSLAALPRAGRL